jgi:methyltransferase (TIGR00027 family)
MQSGQPSRTALAAAAHRAAHQVLDEGRIFSDPLALRILGGAAETLVREAEADPSKRRMRMFIAVRTRFAEDSLAVAIEGGARQIVVLGAGLDTYAYRASVPNDARIFEVDHPATQAWKRERLSAAGISAPASLVYAPVDFESQTLPDGLAAAGFEPAQQTFFTWLGVVPYLTEPAIWSTLGYIASLPNGAHVVFDYSNPPDTFPPERRIEHERREARVAELGEAWLTYHEAGPLHAKLKAVGFTEIEDLGPPQIAARYFPQRVGPAPEHGGHILRAAAVRH